MLTAAALSMDHASFLQLIAVFSGIVIAAIGNTAIFIWRLVAVRDSILQQVTLMKTSIDLEIDMLRRDMNEHKIKIAEEYLRKDSFHLAMNKLEVTTTAAMAKVEAVVSKLDDQVRKSYSHRGPAE